MESKNGRNEFQKNIGEKEQRKLKYKRQEKQSVWKGFEVFGIIGWSVAVPTVVLTLLGMWLDKRFPGEHSYTLALLVGGICLGCLNAWYWISNKMKDMEEDE